MYPYFPAHQRDGVAEGRQGLWIPCGGSDLQFLGLGEMAAKGAGISRTIAWDAPRYHSLLSLLKSPIYAGAYAYGRSRTTVRLEQGRKRIVRRDHRREQWAVFIPDHHEGYIGSAVYENN